MSENTQKRKTSKRVIVTVLIIIIILLSIVLAALLYVSHLLGLINTTDGNKGPMSQEDMQQYLDEHRDELDPDFTGDIIHEDHVELDTVGGEVMMDDDVLNIMLVGHDARPGETRARADAMILCSYNRDRNELVMTSFMRDMYVEIPGYRKHKMNSAYAWGGMDLLEETLAVNFGIKLDGMFAVNFDAFEDVIDELGGVNVELSASEARYLNRYQYSEGVNHLNGADALTYARIRSIGNSDFDRTGRQQKVINAILEQSRGLSLRELNKMAEMVLPLMTTNMSKSDILDCMAMVLPTISGLKIAEKQRIPADDAFRFAWVSDMSVLLPDLTRNREILQSTIYGE